MVPPHSFLVTVEPARASEVCIVGSTAELGCWQVERGLRLHRERGPIHQQKRWVGEARICGGGATKVEYKIVVVGPDGGQPLWEPGPNRELQGASESGEPRSLVFGELGKFVPEPPPAGGAPGEPRVFWEVECSSARPGDQLCVVGSATALGGWDPRRGLRLQTTAATFPVWRGSAHLPPATWKLVLLRAGGEVEWEPGADRQWLEPQRRGKEVEDDEEAESWVACGSFGCPERTDAVPVLPAPASEVAGRGPRAALWAPEGLSAEAAERVRVVVVVQGVCARRLLPFEHSTRSWSLDLAKAGAGSLAVQFLVGGEKTACWSGKDGAAAQSGATPSPPSPGSDGADKEAAGSHTDSPKQHKSGCHVTIARGPTLSSISLASTQDSLNEWDDTSTCSDETKSRSRLGSPLGGFAIHEEPQPCGRQVSDTISERPTHLWSGAHRIPKPGGRCEDSFFCGQAGLGVADGVGSMVQFKKYGVDAAAYAADLMQIAHEVVNSSRSTAQEATATSIAVSALAKAEEQSVTYGASTITVLSLLDGVVGVANLGDSGFMILRETPRGMSVVMRSAEQQHSWNCPYQLMRLPPVLAKQAATKGIRIDTAADAQSYELPVLPGDLLLLFTDGLGDNLHEHDVLQICGEARPPSFHERDGPQPVATSPDDLARALALAAHDRSQDATAWVPFSEASRRQGYHHLGGKEDDITVVAAWVMPGALRR